MQCSQRIKTHQKPNRKPTRNLKGASRPVALHAAKQRRQALKRKLHLI